MNYKLVTSPYGAHMQIVELVGHRKQVLEFGCASGYLSEMLAAQGCQVVGIERDPAAALAAQQHCRSVITADLNTLQTISYPLGSFDVLLFTDVLEHLLDPVTVLRRFLPYLKSNGRVVVSIPNIANWTIRWELIRGRWNHTDNGLMDKTHLHFYTRRTARELLNSADLQIIHEDVTQGLYHMPLYRATMHRLLTHLRLQDRFAYRLAKVRPELWALQFIFVATHKPG